MKKRIANWTGLHGQSRKFLNVSILVIISALLAVSCASRQPIVQTKEVVRTEREIVRDTDIVVEPDSATIRALFECDSLNRVVLKDIEELQGERLKPSITVNPKDDGSMLAQFDCKEDSLKLEIELRDKIIEEQRTTIQTLEVEKHLNKWDSFCIVCGYILMGLLALIIIIFIAKLFIR